MLKGVHNGLKVVRQIKKENVVVLLICRFIANQFI